MSQEYSQTINDIDYHFTITSGSFARVSIWVVNDNKSSSKIFFWLKKGKVKWNKIAGYAIPVCEKDLAIPDELKVIIEKYISLLAFS